MKETIVKLIKSPFVRNVTVMVTGTAGAQAVSMILSPIITRLYGPEAFGVMGTFNAMMNIIVPIAALTYPIAIVLPKSDYNAKGLIRLSLIITGIISTISLIVLILFGEHIINIFNLKQISPFFYLIPLVVIFAGLMQTTEQWFIRIKQFSINARATFLQSLMINGGKVGIGFFYPAAAVLVVLTALGNGLRATMMIMFAKKLTYREENKPEDRKKSLKELAKEHYDFPMYRAPEALLNAVSQGLPPLMLTGFFGPASAGFYTIGRTVLSVPVRLIGQAVGDVFYPRLVEAVNRKENVTALIKKTTLVLCGIGILPFGLIIVFGPFIFSFIFGNDWARAGEYARWIALWIFFGFMNRPSVRALPVLNALRFHLIYTIILLIIRFASLAIGYYIFSSDIVAVALFGISGAILNLGLIMITLKISRRRVPLIENCDRIR